MPEGVEIVTTYSRAGLIERSIALMVGGLLTSTFLTLAECHSDGMAV